MTNYALIDIANLFFRARHVCKGDAYTKAGQTLTIVFRSLRKLYRENKIDHIVFCAEGWSWRHDVLTAAGLPEYKAKRKLARMVATASPKDREEEEVFLSVMSDFTTFISEKTRCTLLQNDGIEGDDWIARWTQLHPNDNHIILSGDSDFLQLLASNVEIYNGLEDRFIRTTGVYNGSGKPLVFSVKGANGKLHVSGTIEQEKAKHEKEQRLKEKEHNALEKERAKLHEKAEKERLNDDPEYKHRPFIASTYDWKEFSFEVEPEWWKKALFIKLIRGDSGDGVFSAFPGVRYESTKNKVGISEAWEDRNSQGYNWNNFMLQRWTKLIGKDEDGNPIKKEVRVIDEFKFNESLIDLTKQPDHIKQLMDTVIVQAIQKEPVNNVGIYFLRFCNHNNLPALAREANDHAVYLNLVYN